MSVVAIMKRAHYFHYSSLILTRIVHLLQPSSCISPRYCVYRQAKQVLQQLHIKNCVLNSPFMCKQKFFNQPSIPVPYNYSSVWKLTKAHKSWNIVDMKMLKAFYVTGHAEDKFSIQNPVYANYLNSLVEEFDALQAGGNSFADESSSSEGSQTLSRANFLHLAVGVIKRLKEKHDEMSELTFLLLDEKDPEMKKMMEAELNLYRNDLREMEEELVDVLVGDDPADNSDIMLEVTAGVGGQEAMLFCQEVFNMYCNYAVRKGWRLAEVTSDTSEQGGSRKASVEISGDGVYRQLKHEGGVHRVQRVPRTEKAGRIHTSTITVSVMPQPKEIDIEIQQKDLKIETFRNSGPGGQSVNTTDSAVRITHIPTGTVAEGREERSQIKNRDIAMKKLKQRIYETILNEQQAEIRASRKLQQGTRARSEKIRTYNFQQDRVTDHRTRESTSNLSHLLAVGGEGLDGLIDNLIQLDRHQTLEMMLEGWEESVKKKER